jgi:hypothetical protein
MGVERPKRRHPTAPTWPAASADASTIVGQGWSPSDYEAFIWDERNGMQELDVVLTALGLDLTGWRLTGAVNISDEGRVIGWPGSRPKRQ